MVWTLSCDVYFIKKKKKKKFCGDCQLINKGRGGVEDRVKGHNVESSCDRGGGVGR